MKSFVTCLVLFLSCCVVHATYEKTMEDYDAGRYDTAFKQFRIISKTGSPQASDAFYMLGVMHEDADGVLLNWAQARTNFQDAATKKHLGARYRLGTAHQIGELDMRVDFDEALKFYMAGVEPFDAKLAASVPALSEDDQQWLSGCYFGVGDIFQNGYGVDKNPALAEEAFRNYLTVNAAHFDAKQRLAHLTSDTSGSDDEEDHVPRDNAAQKAMQHNPKPCAIKH